MTNDKTPKMRTNVRGGVNWDGRTECLYRLAGIDYSTEREQKDREALFLAECIGTDGNEYLCLSYPDSTVDLAIDENGNPVPSEDMDTLFR